MSVTNLGDSDRTIYIPARELAGTREDKLAELDTFLAQLHAVRLALCWRPIPVERVPGGSSEVRTDYRHERSVQARLLQRFAGFQATVAHRLKRWRS